MDAVIPQALRDYLNTRMQPDGTLRGVINYMQQDQQQQIQNAILNPILASVASSYNSIR